MPNHVVMTDVIYLGPLRTISSWLKCFGRASFLLLFVHTSCYDVVVQVNFEPEFC